jgi:hypothetical protein
MMLFDYDWWHGEGLARQVDDAKRRCALQKLSGAEASKSGQDKALTRLIEQIETRIIIYLKDASIYEVKELADVGRKGYLAFECLPADEAYRVGAFVVAVPYDEIARVEVFAVHKSEKPEESPMIKGFGAAGPRPARPEERPA